MEIKKTIKRLSKSPTSDCVREVYLVECDDGGKYVWKPIVSNYLESNIRHEVVASEISRIVRFDGIPETVLHGHEGRKGSLRQYAEGETWSERCFRGTRINIESMQRLAVFDFMILHSDRGYNNLVILPNGDCVGIDNESILTILAPVSLNISYCMGREFFPGTKELIENMVASREEIENRLKTIDAGPRVIDMVSERIAALEATIRPDAVLYNFFGFR